ncbi:MAG: glutamate synthase-related protein, partial [Gammaproteobacteria bacterium]|nr:glutamate synthase-related protein [Gammaproteobacteria bacterium]
MNKVKIAKWDQLKPLKPAYALIANVDLVVIRWKDEAQASVLYGRCLHRDALLADGHVDGDNLICGVHNWDYAYKTGVSSYNPDERLKRFHSWVEQDHVWVDEDEISEWERDNPQPYDRNAYLGLYADPHGGPEEPHYKYIQHLAEHGLSKVGHHGRVAAMGVPRDQLPQWEDIQILTAQLHKLPLLDDIPVGTDVVIGPNASKPLKLKIPLLVSDMSFGALSEEAKTALAKGAELAGTGICSGEGGMLPEEQLSNSRYFYELASARFGFSMDKLKAVQAFHFKCGQGAKTGTGGHLPGAKVTGKIAEVRGLEEGRAAISPARFPDWEHVDQFRAFA